MFAAQVLDRRVQFSNALLRGAESMKHPSLASSVLVEARMGFLRDCFLTRNFYMQFTGYEQFAL